MGSEENNDYCRMRRFGDTNGEKPVYALICDNDFPISYRERACLNACRAHWDFSKGYLTLYTENPDRQAKMTNENYIHGIVIDPATFLRNFGKSRLAKAHRLEKESKQLINQWNKCYGPSAKNESGVCMPKSVMFQLGRHTWPTRGAGTYSEEKSFMLLEISTYSFAESLKEKMFKSANGESANPKITMEDLEVYIKIASTKINKTKSDKSNTAASSHHTIFYSSLNDTHKASKDLLKTTAFDRWGFKIKMSVFLKMLASPFMMEVANDCTKVLKCKGLDDWEDDIEEREEDPHSSPPASQSSKTRKTAAPAATRKRGAVQIKKRPASSKAPPQKVLKAKAVKKRPESHSEEEDAEEEKSSPPNKKLKFSKRKTKSLSLEEPQEEEPEEEEEEIEEEEEEEEESEYQASQELIPEPKKRSQPSRGKSSKKGLGEKPKRVTVIELSKSGQDDPDYEESDQCTDDEDFIVDEQGEDEEEAQEKSESEYEDDPILNLDEVEVVEDQEGPRAGKNYSKKARIAPAKNRMTNKTKK